MTEPTQTPGPSGSDPLKPDASMADVLARVEHLSGSGLASDPADVSPEQAVPTDSGLGSEAQAAIGAPPAKRPRRGLLAAGGGIVAVILGIGAKVLIGLAVAGVGSQVLASVFGGPFEKLPQSTRDGFEQRLNAAIGSDASQLSEADYAARYNTLVADGESRLEDAKLIQELAYLDEMYAKADPATCAKTARSELAATGSTFELSDTMWALLTQDELTNHVGIQIEAIEAAAAKSPPQRTVSASEANAAFQQIFSTITADQSTVLTDLTSGKTRTDPETCDAVRAFYHAELALDPASVALVARYNVSP